MHWLKVVLGSHSQSFSAEKQNHWRACQNLDCLWFGRSRWSLRRVFLIRSQITLMLVAWGPDLEHQGQEARVSDGEEQEVVYEGERRWVEGD